ncbi:hypothetical protein BDZ45DRAFT_638027 [Acephala macrosclerotiorum]|nr:hypothetical protein BDZ45DRAFT_638027 [Acephala macrosclerotiorum]
MSKPSLPKSPDVIPDEKAISDAYNLPVLSHDGKSTRFGQMIDPKDGVITVIVIFIRHFFCSLDQDYVRSLPTSITPNVLSTLPLPIGSSRVVLIGCGDPSRILPYTVETSCEFPIFTDPTCRIYEKLQMNKSLASSTRPAYMKHSLFSLIMRSVRQMVWSGFGAFKGGGYSQNGGEWIFRAGKCEWVHRMKTTSDHLTAEELVKVLKGEGNSHNGIER